VSRRRGGKGAGAGFAHVYEGPEVLGALLARAGSPRDAEEAAAVFARAVKAGETRSVVIPTLFPDEPRFGSPEEARRLYANLFGLWDRIAAGRGAHDDAPEVVNEPAAPPLPERGSIAGEVVPTEMVEAAWRHLAASAPRELQRRRDRFTNVQPDLVAWLEATPLPEAGAAAALELAFEAWAMLDQAFGDRLGAVEYHDLRDLESEPPPIEASQPALAAYVDEQLENLADEDPGFGPEERAQVEKTLAAAVAALSGAIRQPS
jgi:hypothetical protein